MSVVTEITTVEQAVSVLQRAAEHIDAGRLRPAEQDLNLVLRASPDQADALHLLGHVYSRRGDQNGAIGYLERAIIANPQDTEIRVTLAGVLLEEGRARDAVSVVRAALSQAPDIAVLHYHHGRALGELGECEAAISAFENVIKLDHATFDIHRMIGVLYHQRGDLDQAFDAYERALILNPNDMETRYYVGSLHLRRRDHAAAAAAFQVVLDQSPDHIGALRSYGAMLARMDDYAAAIQPLRRGHELDPDDPEIAFELLYALTIAGDPGEAVQIGEAYLGAHPNSDFIHQQMAFAYQRVKGFEKAIEAADAVIKGPMISTTALSMKSAALQELGHRADAQYILNLDDLVVAAEKQPPAGYASIGDFNHDLVDYIENNPTLA